MADAVFYDGETARRRTVSLKIGASSLDLHEGDDWIASWPTGAVRRREAASGVLRLMLEGGPALARLDVTDPGDQASIRAHCARLELGEPKERTGRIIFWSALAAVSLTLCVVFLLPIVAERLTPLIPLSVERRLGTAVDNQVKFIFGGKVCDGTRGLAALETLSARLRASTDVGMETHIAVLESKIPNAIALPGGRIYLFKGLLDQAESADEVAGVLAHEMGHAAHRDSLRSLIQSGGASYLLGLLFGDVSGGGAVVIATQLLIDSAHSREAETAADAFAAQAMLALGRPPKAMGLLLKRIEGNEKKLPAFLSTHPVTDQRLKSLEQQAPAHTGEPLLSEEEWRALKEICKTS
ncbi:M48 family metallopeptidase [Microvirga aerophila]|uniref:Metalloendopeptidase n=1 Tax=Microvirga aerophila TaxID=670291 RepID=A0A512BMI6_9HYPH|nr:M48 family metallopeptidase [Microvirga aerophila]GEO13172.1 metalloendopeptidase [Microvirga aerophila]